MVFCLVSWQLLGCKYKPRNGCNKQKSRACESVCREENNCMGLAGGHLCCPGNRWQRTRVRVVRLGRVCVIAAIVLCWQMTDEEPVLEEQSRNSGLAGTWCINISAHYFKQLKIRAYGSHWVLNPLKFGFCLFVFSITDGLGYPNKK